MTPKEKELFEKYKEIEDLKMKTEMLNYKKANFSDREGDEDEE